MDTEDLVVDDSSKGKVVEQVGAVAPHVHRAELAQAFVVKAVYLSDLARLVVASDKSHSFRIPDFKGNEQEEGLD